jgi:hypothetical protein
MRKHRPRLDEELDKAARPDEDPGARQRNVAVAVAVLAVLVLLLLAFIVTGGTGAYL